MILAQIKEHPGYVIGAVVAFVVMYWYFSSDGATSVGALDTTNSVDAATSLQTAQLAASAQVQQTNAALQANADNNAAQLDIAKLNFDYMTTHDTLAAGVANNQIDAEADTTRAVSTLQAGVQTSAINAQTQQTQIVATAQTQQQQVLANALTTQSYLQAQTYQKAISCTGFKSLFGC